MERRPFGQVLFRWLLSLVLLGLLSLAGYFMLFSAFFHIKVVEVTGVYTLDPQKVEAVASIPFDENLFLQDNLKKERDILKAFPIVEKVRIRQVLPDKMIIEITEKSPRLVALAPPDFLLLDQRGQIIDIVGEVNQVNAPMLTGITFSHDVAEGQLLVSADLRKAMEFLKDVPENRRYLVREITVSKSSISIFPEGSYEVMMGSSGEVHRKMNVLEALIRESALLGNTIEYIDLTNPDKIIKKTKEGIQ